MSEQQKNDVLANDEAQGQVMDTPVVQETIQQVSPGQQLASQRKLKSLSVEEVASYLKLAPRQVHAIEADDYASLPGMAITRGFVRTYAKLLGMDGAALLEALPKQEMRLGAVAGSERVQQSTFQASTLPLRDRNKVVPVAIAAAVVVAIVAATGYWMYRNGSGPASPLAWWSSTEEVATADALTNDVEVPVAAPVEPGSASDEQKVSAELPKFESIPVAGAPAAIAPTVPAPVATPAVLTSSRPDVASAGAAAPVASAPEAESAKPVLKVVNSKDLLRLVMREDAWVEIRRDNGDIVFSRLLLAGTSESFDVPEPLQLVVGNASGVTATLRGKSLDLPVSKNNVARINLK